MMKPANSTMKRVKKKFQSLPYSTTLTVYPESYESAIARCSTLHEEKTRESDEQQQDLSLEEGGDGSTVHLEDEEYNRFIGATIPLVTMYRPTPMSIYCLNIHEKEERENSRSSTSLRTCEGKWENRQPESLYIYASFTINRTNV